MAYRRLGHGPVAVILVHGYSHSSADANRRVFEENMPRYCDAANLTCCG